MGDRTGLPRPRPEGPEVTRGRAPHPDLLASGQQVAAPMAPHPALLASEQQEGAPATREVRRRSEAPDCAGTHSAREAA
eukprot:9600762-Alexandrium_andersonii.AAC.1